MDTTGCWSTTAQTSPPRTKVHPLPAHQHTHTLKPPPPPPPREAVAATLMCPRLFPLRLRGCFRAGPAQRVSLPAVVLLLPELSLFGPDGDTALHVAASHNMPEVRALLLLLLRCRRGALPQCPELSAPPPRPPLCARQVCKYLLDHGADPNATNHEARKPHSMMWCAPKGAATPCRPPPRQAVPTAASCLLTPLVRGGGGGRGKNKEQFLE